MPDSVATPIEKLFALEQHYVETGKEFKENEMRQYVNDWWLARGGDSRLLLPMVDNPKYYPEDPKRARAVRMDDREAKAEMERLKAEAQQKISEMKQDAVKVSLWEERARRQEEEIQRMREELARLKGEASKPQPEPEPAPAIEHDAEIPDLSWTKSHLLEYARRHNIVVDGDMTKSEIYQTIILSMEPVA